MPLENAYDNDYGADNAVLSAPNPSVQSYGAGLVRVVARAPTARGRITSSGLHAAGVAGAAAAIGGGMVRAVARPCQAKMTAVFGTVARIALVAPMPQVQAKGVLGSVMWTRAPLQGAAPAVQSRGGAAPVSIIAPHPVVQAHGMIGSVLRAHLVASRPIVQATMQTRGLSFAHIMGKAFAPAPSLRAVLVAPSPAVMASGGLHTIKEYEAYAVNLRTSVEGGGYEVTRYTNFQFSNVVRAHGRYFGVAQDGLFALEGNQDAGNPTQWALRVASTDFGMPQKKHVAAGYAAGRLPANVVFEVIAGEMQDEQYRYDNLRGSSGQTYRCKFGRGVNSRYYAFGMSGAGPAELHGLEFDVQQRARRI